MELNLPTWLVRELQKDADGKSVQWVIKEILKREYHGVNRKIKQ